jgi:hypothetical protein
MRFPSPILTALSAAAVAALVAGCSSSAVAPTGTTSGPGSINRAGVKHYAVISAIPKGFVPVRPSHSIFVSPNAAGNGEVYVSSFLATTINAYKIPNSGNHAPKCTDSPINSPNGINMGPNRTLWDPDGGTRSIIPFAKNCGGEGTPIASFNSNQPSDVAFDSSGNMFVANTGGGGADEYTGGTYVTTLTNPALSGVLCFGVATDGTNVFVSSNANVVVEFVGGAEPGVVLTSSGMTGTSAPIGMTVDKHHNLVVVDINSGLLVYAPPYTQAPSKTQAAHGSSAYGHLDKTNEFLYVGDFGLGAADVYTYPGLHYKYSITNGLSQSNDVEGVAVDFVGNN